MTWLAIAVLILAQQPAKAPEGKGAAKSVVSQDTQQAKAPQNDASAKPPVAPISTSSTNTPHPSANNPQQETAHTSQSVPAQGTYWSEIFTGLLVIVGFMQARLMFLQWRTYLRQAEIMEQQRTTMQSQWTTMQGQLAQMEASGRQTDELIEHAEKSADAAKANAESAKLNAQAVINAERPLLIIKVEKQIHPTVGGHAIFKIFAINYGRTPARIISCAATEEACVSPDKDLEVPYPSRTSELWTHKVIPPKEPKEALDIATFYPRSDLNKHRLVAAVEQGHNATAAYHLIIYGEVRYCEIGSEGQSPYRSRFCYRWSREEFSDIGGSLILCGPREYNEIT